MFLLLGFFVVACVVIYFMTKKMGVNFAAKENEKKETSNVSTDSNVAENTSFNEEYLADVAKNSISQLCDYGMTQEDAEHFLDKLALCTTEENYLYLIDSCQKMKQTLRDNRVNELSEKLSKKEEKGVNPDTIAMLRECLETATTKEQLDRIEQHIAKLRATSKKSKTAPKPQTKTASKTA